MSYCKTLGELHHHCYSGNNMIQKQHFFTPTMAGGKGWQAWTQASES